MQRWILIYRRTAVQALNTTASLFETLSETNSKSSKAIQKEYDGINDICGKFFKKVAKEERAHDDALEALDNKLKKANFAYDKRVRSHPSNAAAAASGAHEQFVPLLSSLTEEMSRTKIQHGRKLAGRREEAAREVARAVSALAEMEWKRACENVKRVGLEVGALVGVRCLLGDGMPPDWPEDVTDTKAGLGAQDDVRRSAVHAEAMVGREDLMPPRPHYSMDNRRPSDASSTSSGIRQPVLGASTHQPGTAASPRMYATQLQPISYESPYRSPPQPAPGKPAHTDDSSARPAPQPRRTSYPEQRGERDWSGEATVLARPARQTPSLEQTFASFPHPHSSHAPTSRNVSGGSTSSSAPAPATTSADSSPVRSRPSHESYNSSGSLVSLRESATVQRMPNVEAGLHHVVSHRVAGYGAAYEGDEKQQREDGGSKVTMPDGFVMEETGDYSPEKPKRAGASQNWDRRRTSENSDSSSSNDARQASQSIAAALERSVEAGNRLSRSMSVESNASEKSFVARMKLKYAQEREEASAKQELSASGAGLQNQRRADPTSPPLGGASARVSSMAQRFEQRPPAGATSHAGSSSSVSSSFAGPSRPAHAHRQSLPVLPTSGRYTSPPPTSSYTHSSMTEPLSTLSRLAEQHEARRYSNEERVAGLAGNSEEEQHPDVCACESCTARSYGTFETLGSRVNDRDSARQIRRVSMPVIGGVPQ